MTRRASFLPLLAAAAAAMGPGCGAPLAALASFEGVTPGSCHAISTPPASAAAAYALAQSEPGIDWRQCQGHTAREGDKTPLYVALAASRPAEDLCRLRMKRFRADAPLETPGRHGAWGEHRAFVLATRGPCPAYDLDESPLYQPYAEIDPRIKDAGYLRLRDFVRAELGEVEPRLVKLNNYGVVHRYAVLATGEHAGGFLDIIDFNGRLRVVRKESGVEP